jgi:hypothetical protein
MPRWDRQPHENLSYLTMMITVFTGAAVGIPFILPNPVTIGWAVVQVLIFGGWLFAVRRWTITIPLRTDEATPCYITLNLLALQRAWRLYPALRSDLDPVLLTSYRLARNRLKGDTAHTINSDNAVHERVEAAEDLAKEHIAARAAEIDDLDLKDLRITLAARQEMRLQARPRTDNPEDTP